MVNHPSMFEEFKDRVERFKAIEEGNKPAMIILEREESGENKHAMIGEAYDLLMLYHWGLNILTEQTKDNNFDKTLEWLKTIHDGYDHVKIMDIKKEL